MSRHDDDTRPAGTPKRNSRKPLDELGVMRRFHALLGRRLLELEPAAQERVRQWLKAQLS